MLHQILMKSFFKFFWRTGSYICLYYPIATYVENAEFIEKKFNLHIVKKDEVEKLPFKSGFLSTFVLFNLLTISFIRFSTLTVRT